MQGRWCYLYRAVDSTGATIDFLLSALRDAAAAERLFRKALADPLHPQPRLINTDQAPIYGSAIPDIKKEGTLRRRCRHRPVQNLNNILEQDHRAIKRRVKAKQGCREFHAARRTIQGYEAMHMIRKGQARWVSGSDVRRQIQFIEKVFELADGQLAQIAASIQEFGFVNPILVGPDGRIIAGEGRYRATLTLRMREVPVIVLDHLSEVQCRALAIADNRIALNAGWDEQMLREQLAALEDDSFNLALLGFEDEELARQLANQDTAGLTDEDEVPAIPIHPVTSSGDLWLLRSGKGRTHRLLCGDATNGHDTARLLNAQPVPILMVTDPPYGVDLEPEWRERAGLNPRTRQGGNLVNDQRVDWSEAWALFSGDVVYVWHAGIHAAEVALGLQRCGLEIRSQIVWVKQHFAISRGAYHWQHEPC